MMPIAVKSLGAMESFDFKLYIWPVNGVAARLYKDRHIPFTRRDLKSLQDRGTFVLYVAEDDISAYQEHVRKNVLGNNRLPLSDRFEILQRTARNLLKDTFGRYDCREIFETTAELSDHMSQMICDRQAALGEILAVMSHDYSAFTHCINVSVFSVLLARHLGFSDPCELAAIGQGAMLHDIGKFQHDNLRSFPSTGPEASQLQKEHPLVGFKAFSQSDLTNGQLMMIYQHHERFGGQGYPVGLVGTEIHPWSRVCAVANTLTKFMSAQSGNNRRVPDAEALQFLQLQSGRFLDEEIVKCWISALKNNRRGS